MERHVFSKLKSMIPRFGRVFFNSEGGSLHKTPENLDQLSKKLESWHRPGKALGYERPSLRISPSSLIFDKSIIKQTHHLPPSFSHHPTLPTVVFFDQKLE